MYMLYTLIGGGGQMSNTFFESGDKCPALLIIRGEMSSYTIFHMGGGGKCLRGQMSYTLISCASL